MRIVNLGILAHVDAGKTTLTERLLYETGVIETVGSVDDGSAQTDFLPLERQRGITIKSAVVSFVTGGISVNLIDTPGHPDFIAEVERVLSVLDGVVLVVSGVDGVQPQTRVLMRALERLHIPTLIFINKIDCLGAHVDHALRSISERLTPDVILMGSTDGVETREARVQAYGPGDAGFVARLIDLLAGHDDAFLAAYLDDESALTYDQLRGSLATLTKRTLVHPVFPGSAMTGAGVGALLDGIEALVPAGQGDAAGPVSGTVFKVERGQAGEKIAYVRLFSGTVRTRDRLTVGRDREGKVTAMRVFDHGAATQSGSIGAGQIGKLWGLGDARIGDTIGDLRAGQAHHHFDPPSLETAVLPRRPGDKGALHAALGQLAEQDPLINLRQDDSRQELYVSLYGEVQKEVIQETLMREYDLDVDFRETSVICIERPAGRVEAVERLGKGGNPFLATVGLRVEPAPEGAGVQFRLEAELVTIPIFVYNAVDEFQRWMHETVQHILQQGLQGWSVTDCVVTMTECGYASPGSSARDFRLLSPLVLMRALAEAGTVVCEPIHHFHLEIPTDTYGTTVPILARLGADLHASTIQNTSYLLDGDIRAARVHDLRHQLPAATHGEGLLESSFDHYRPVAGPPPSRPRSDHNPLNRKEYLLHVVRRV